MISPATKRRWGRWLVALFVAAQLAGVAPLVSSHTVHIAGSQAAQVGHQVGHHVGHQGDDGAGVPAHQHRPGDADSGPQHHALHDLAGVLADPLPPQAADITYAPRFVPPPAALASADPARLERPPKSILSV